MGRKVRPAQGRKRQALSRAKTPAQARKGAQVLPFPSRPSGAKPGGKAAASEAPKPPRCGDFGGLTATGSPCQHEAGWGTATPRLNLCCEHDAEAVGRLDALKQRVLDGLADPLKHLAQVAEMIGTGPTTIYNWRVADPAFDAAVVACCATRDSLRVHLVDDAWFGRIVAGKAPAGTEIFWMKNKAPALFRDRHEIAGPNGSPLGVVHTMMFGDQEITF